MEEGDGGGSGGAAGGAAGGDGGGAGGRSAGEGGVYDDGLDDLWPARVSSEDFLGQMWEDDPATTSTWTSRHAGGGDAEPPVYAVDEDGQLFNSQVGSNNPVGQGSDNHPQFYDVDEDGELSDSDEDADVGTHDAAFHMGDFADSVEIRMKEKAEVDEILEEMRKQKEDPMSHCQGDTDIEDLFITADEAGAEPCTEPNRGEDDPTGPSAADAPRASAADAPRASAATAPRPSAAAAPGPSVADAPGASAAAAPRASAAAAGRGSAAAHRRHAGSSSSTACSTAPPARAAFAPPRSTTPSTESEHEAGYPAYKRTRTWGYMNCGYVDPDHDAGPSN
ncbi:hypothetical protein ACQ4PT_026581 [Festuca glaucescens]